MNIMQSIQEALPVPSEDGEVRIHFYSLEPPVNTTTTTTKRGRGKGKDKRSTSKPLSSSSTSTSTKSRSKRCTSL